MLAARSGCVRWRMLLVLGVVAGGLAVLGQWLLDREASGSGAVTLRSPIADQSLPRQEPRSAHPLPPGWESAEPESIPITVATPRPEATVADLARLRVRGTTPDGGGVMGVLVELAAEQPLFAGVAPPGPRGQHSDATTRRIAKGLGLADFDDVKPGVRAVARILDATGRELGRLPVEPLQPGEVRIVAVPVHPAAVNVAVLVLDLRGVPVAKARVEVADLQAADGQPATSPVARVTDDGGHASIGCMAPGSVALRVSHFGSMVLDLPEAPIPADAQPLVVHIDRGRRVSVRGIDEFGSPMELEDVTAAAPGSSHLYQFLPDPGTSLCGWYAEALPDGPLDFRVAVKWQLLEVRSSDDDVEVAMPDTELVEVTWDRDVSAAVYACWVERLGSQRRGEWLSEDERSGRRVTLRLGPGIYRIGLSGPNASRPGVSMWLTGMDTVSVRAGQTARLHLGPP